MGISQSNSVDNTKHNICPNSTTGVIHIPSMYINGRVIPQLLYPNSTTGLVNIPRTIYIGKTSVDNTVDKTNNHEKK